MNKINYIDGINLVLILLAAGLAFTLPFQTFVIAYLIIGPLHYLTETQWLKEKGFFLENKKRGLFFVLPALFLMAFIQLEESRFFNEKITSFLDLWSNAFIYFAFFVSVALVLIKNTRLRLFIVIMGLALIFFLNDLSVYHILVGILLPTIIHVYVFTVFFMLYGWKKQKTITGLVNIILLAISPLIIFLPVDQLFISSDFFNSLFLKTGFQTLNSMIESWLPSIVKRNYLPESGLSIRIQSFLAFIYLYHYLNWFSKTNQIKWHRTLKDRSVIGIGLIWGLIIGLYFVNFKLGLVVAILFSYIHVFAEFPLNIRTITSLIKR